MDPLAAREAVGPNVTLQGNLDPQDLYKSGVRKMRLFAYFTQNFINEMNTCKLQEEVKQLTETMVRKFGKHRYIANLGHGITPLTPIESMTIFTETVHSTSATL